MDTPLARLNHRQLAFVRAYTGPAFADAAAAARIAGYRSANGSKVLKSAAVQDAVDFMMADAGMSAAEILARLSSQARATLRDFVSWQQVEDPHDGQIRTVARIDLDKVEAAHAWGNVSEVTVSPDGAIKIKLHNVQRALELLGKARSLFVDRHEVAVSAAVSLREMSQEDLDQLEQLLDGAKGGSNG